MSGALEPVSDQEVENRLNALIAANANAVMTSAMSDPIMRLGIIKTLEARSDEALTTDERVWLEWCRGFR